MIHQKNAKQNTALKTVLVLQGGGALGAYHGGVFEVLAAQNHKVDWAVGTSIGAINAAIVAGNPPEQRIAKLQEFWNIVAQDEHWAGYWPALSDNPMHAWLEPLVSAGKVFETVSKGIPGFFVPRQASAWNLNQQVSTDQASFYDTSPLLDTLEKLVDFNYLNAGHMRCTVCAVAVATGELAVFDSAKQKISAKHIMASGALPPSFAPVVIDGKAYWDGGIYSNTPMDVVLDDGERSDTLCFMVDLWDPTEAEPRSISQAMSRLKDIQYASRSTEHLEDHLTMQNLRHAIRVLASRLPEKDRKDKNMAALAALGCSSRFNIVRLIMKALPSDEQSKDIDFSRSTLRKRWDAGKADALRALRHKSWLKPLPPHVGLAVHELVQED